MINRAIALLEVRSVQDDARTFEGWATTPSPDRLGDEIDPLGAKFASTVPLLHQHDAERPIGWAKLKRAGADGITFTATIPTVAEPGPLQDRVNTAWGEIKAGLIRAVSIGFRVLKGGIKPAIEGDGMRFTAIEIMELSAVTVPANAEATITNFRSFDCYPAQAASGHEDGGTTGTPAPRLGTTQTPRTEGRKMPKTIAEQISAFEATRQAKAARMANLMDAAGDTGSTLDEAASQEYDGLELEVADVDKHLVRLRSMQRFQATQAVAVDTAVDPASSAVVRSGVPLASAPVPAFSAGRAAVPIVVPKGTAFTRYAIAVMRSKGNRQEALETARAEPGWSTTPEVVAVLESQARGVDLERIMRAAVAAGTTQDPVWAGPLVQYNIMASEFVELLRPATILGRIPGLTRVPFNVKIPRQTAGSSVGWVGEAKPKPLSSLAFDTITLLWAKAAGIVVLTDELVRFSNPSAEALVQNDLIKTIAQFLDQQFTDPAIAAVANVSPASITNGVAPIPASGTDETAFRADLVKMINAFTAANFSTAGAVLLMSETQAAAIGLMLTPLGTQLYPGVTATGGSILGIPVVTSQNAGLLSAPTSRIIMLQAPEILLADDGQVLLDASREASVQMSSTPDDPVAATTIFMSLWQNNMVGIRAERWINWVKRRAGAVQFISGANYA